MGLNIKNERVHDLARRAAAATGKTQTGAIEEALLRLLDDLGQDPGSVARGRRVDLAWRIAREYADDPGDEAREIRTIADLYDDAGLPR